jgi:hypothetical protein
MTKAILAATYRPRTIVPKPADANRYPASALAVLP